MARMRILVPFAFLFAISFGCAGAGRPRVESPAPGATYNVAPPYHDPEYALRLSLPDRAGWEERYNIDAGEGAPDPILRLTRRSDGATIEVLFLPRSSGTPADFAAHLRSDAPSGTTFTAMLSTADEASYDSASGTSRSRHRIVHRAGMTRSHAYLRLTAPAAGFASAATAFDAVAASITVASTGPLSPKAALAQCLADRGVRLYGTWWCGPCHMQEQLFGDGAARLDHTQCSAPDSYDQLPVCNAAGIRSYPTWVFPDGSRLEGVQSLADLATKAGCPVPRE